MPLLRAGFQAGWPDTCWQRSPHRTVKRFIAAILRAVACTSMQSADGIEQFCILRCSPTDTRSTSRTSMRRRLQVDCLRVPRPPTRMQRSPRCPCGTAIILLAAAISGAAAGAAAAAGAGMLLWVGR